MTDMSIDFPYRSALLQLARHAIAVAVNDDATASDEPPDPTLPFLRERRGVFVTLSQRSRLRGCIGRVEPDSPLRVMIPDVARSAALADPRFPAVQAHELASIVIEISVLSTPELATPEEIEVGRHGLIVSARGRRGLLLPQVATHYAWSREQFLDEVCLKAGLTADAWRDNGTRLQSFTAEIFSEDSI
jgi:AmmeMemoRadiSam system protein A